MALGLVDCHVIDTKMQLTEGEQSIVDVLGLDEVVDQVIWNLLRRLRLPGSLLFPGGEVLGRQGRVMLAEELELTGGPAPVLQHLRGSFDEVLDSACPVEARVRRYAYKIMDTMTQFYICAVNINILVAETKPWHTME